MQPLRSRTSPMKKRTVVAVECLAISHCFSSSRENTTMRRGL